MKTWNDAILEELSLGATAHRWRGQYSDGGYIGDGVLSGHNTPCEDEAVIES